MLPQEIINLIVQDLCDPEPLIVAKRHYLAPLLFVSRAFRHAARALIFQSIVLTPRRPSSDEQRKPWSTLSTALTGDASIINHVQHIQIVFRSPCSNSYLEGTVPCSGPPLAANLSLIHPTILGCLFTLRSSHSHTSLAIEFFFNVPQPLLLGIPAQDRVRSIRMEHSPSYRRRTIANSQPALTEDAQMSLTYLETLDIHCRDANTEEDFHGSIPDPALTLFTLPPVFLALRSLSVTLGYFATGKLAVTLQGLDCLLERVPHLERFHMFDEAAGTNLGFRIAKYRALLPLGRLPRLRTLLFQDSEAVVETIRNVARTLTSIMPFSGPLEELHLDLVWPIIVTEEAETILDAHAGGWSTLRNVLVQIGTLKKLVLKLRITVWRYRIEDDVLNERTNILQEILLGVVNELTIHPSFEVVHSLTARLG